MIYKIYIYLKKHKYIYLIIFYISLYKLNLILYKQIFMKNIEVSLAEWSKAAALGAVLKGRGFESLS